MSTRAYKFFPRFPDEVRPPLDLSCLKVCYSGDLTVLCYSNFQFTQRARGLKNTLLTVQEPRELSDTRDYITVMSEVSRYIFPF